MDIVGKIETEKQALEFLRALISRFSATPTTDVDLKTILESWIENLTEKNKNLSDIDKYLLEKLVEIKETLDIFHQRLQLILEGGE